MNYPSAIGRCFAGFLLFICLSAPASAIRVDVVGAVDDFLGSAIFSSSGKATEESWVSNILGDDFAINYKDDAINAADWEWVPELGNVWAHSLDTDPGYFLLKLGVGNSGADTHYLYKNIAALSWAVIDLTEMLNGQDPDFSFNFGRVSHIVESGDAISLAEAGSFGLLLLGLGLLVLRIVRKSRAA